MANNKNWKSLFSIWLVLHNMGMLGRLHANSPQNILFSPAIYIFGDSTVDVGTNNYLPKSRARADMPHNGIDYVGSEATGRFSNGYNVADYIAKFLGQKESPPSYLSLLNKKKRIPKSKIPTRGINFASGGSGILDDTGKRKWGDVVSMGKQVRQFRNLRNAILKSRGKGELVNISKSMFIISVGSNDIFEVYADNDYYLTAKTERDILNTLIDTFGNQLKELYKLGARKFGIVGVPAMGCCPIQRVRSKTGGCLEVMNTFSDIFSKAVGVLMKALALECKGLLYSHGDVFTMSNFIMKNRIPLGFWEVAKACCGKGKMNAEERCEEDSNMCFNRNDYMFWDQYHSSQAANGMLALYLFGGPPLMVSPMSFTQLALA